VCNALRNTIGASALVLAMLSQVAAGQGGGTYASIRDDAPTVEMMQHLDSDGELASIVTPESQLDYGEPLIGTVFEQSALAREPLAPKPLAPKHYQIDDRYWQILPDGLIYRSYLAGTKESRLSATVFSDVGEGDEPNVNYLKGNLGGRIAIFRYGTDDPIRPQGFELDIEASAQVRLNTDQEMDVDAVDFRAGVPLTWGWENHQIKFGYYHLSSHLGDEFLLRNPGYPRLNFARDVLIFGYSHYVRENLRVYGEAGWAFWSDVAQEWEFQFGVDYAPTYATGPRGAPFVAVNVHLREEVEYGGGITVQAGWAWRGDTSPNMMRVGIHYYNGESNQFSLFDEHEQQLGFGLWYDY